METAMLIHRNDSNPARGSHVSRRMALRVGASGFLPGLSLPGLLRIQAQAATGREAKAKSCIFLFLQGGPSTIDMWDLKPEAPSEIRGPYKAIRTNVPGTLVGEHCFRTAKIADKFTMLRNHSHTDNGHTTGCHYVLTGVKAAFADGANTKVPVNDLYPSIGSVVARELGPRGGVPPYINMPHPLTAGGPGFYGAEHAPFVIESDPVQPDFEVKDLRADERLGEGRVKRRGQVLESLEKGLSQQGRAGTMDTYYQKARDLMTSPQARKAFDLKAESERRARNTGRPRLGSVRCCHGGWWRRGAGSWVWTTGAGTRISRVFPVWRRT